MRSRGWQPGDVMRMLDLLSELWPDARHGPGYAFMAQRLPYDDWDMQLCFEGDVLVGWGWSTGWRRPVGLSYEFRPGYLGLLAQWLDWSRAERVVVKSGDSETTTLLEDNGFQHDPEAPWIQWNIRPLLDIEEPMLPPGYRLSTMAEYDDFGSRAAAHRSAFTLPGAPSRHTDAVYECVRKETNWRADLDCVVLSPDGKVAAYALGWLDSENQLGELEPVGVCADQQRRGLGRAACLWAMECLRKQGAETVLVGSRGDDGHPGPGHSTNRLASANFGGTFRMRARNREPHQARDCALSPRQAFRDDA